MLWKDGPNSLEKLTDLKESYLVEVAELAKAQSVEHEPAFDWWVRYILKKRDRIIAAVNKRYHKRMYKFGFELPMTVLSAKEIDKETNSGKTQ